MDGASARFEPRGQRCARRPASQDFAGAITQPPAGHWYFHFKIAFPHKVLGYKCALTQRDQKHTSLVSSIMNTFVSFVLLAVCTIAAIPSILSAPLEKRADFSVGCHGNTVNANGLLTSTCTSFNGDHVPASLSLDSCVGNVNGQLIR